MTQAQKIAKAKFKQAIAYRQKTGVSLKEAFAKIYGKKKVVKKAATKKVVKKAAPKKVAVKRVVKKAAKKVSGVKDSKILKKELAKKGLKMPHGYTTVKRKRKISGVKNKPTESQVLKSIQKAVKTQKSHMGRIGSLNTTIISDLKQANDKLTKWQKVLLLLEAEKLKLPASMKKIQNIDIKRVKEAIKEQKTHITQIKKNIK
jgi:hypothetical protein